MPPTRAKLEDPPKQSSAAEARRLPPLRDCLAVPLTARDGRNIGLVQLTDKYEGDFTGDDEGILLLLSQIASSVIENQRLMAKLQVQGAEFERRVQERTAQLKAINNELASFSRSVSHDLRAPLRAIDGFVRALEEDCAPQFDDTSRNYVRRMRQAVERMGKLIDALLVLARVTNAPVNDEDVDLSTVSENIADELRRAAPDAHVQLVIAPGLTARGDPELLNLMMQNLIGNAWKFSSKRPSPRIEVGVVDEGGTRVHFVRDNGLGFDPKYGEQVFMPFVRLRSAEDFPGSGLGLATVKRIVERHDGKIWVESTPGQGTTFYFVL